jgi:hypothetical protein
MFNKVLSFQQKKLLPLLSEFSEQFGLVGGTAIALQIGHRKSIDFDLFTNDSFESLVIRRKIREHHVIEQTMIDSQVELTVIVDGVKLTFYSYPYPLNFTQFLADVIQMPNLATLAAMKVFALGRRAKWKDYVDLYFLIKRLGLKKIIETSQTMFGAEFNQKLFRSQLTYFEDIDESEAVDYLLEADSRPKKNQIKAFLSEQAVQ